MPPRIDRLPFIGRQHELVSIAHRLNQARAGHGSMVLVSGEAGIGMTRLVEEFAASCDDTVGVS